MPAENKLLVSVLAPSNFFPNEVDSSVGTLRNYRDAEIQKSRSQEWAICTFWMGFRAR